MLIVTVVLSGCHKSSPLFDDQSLANYEERSISQSQAVEETSVADFAKIRNRRPAILVGELTDELPSVERALRMHMPDPSVATQVFEVRLKDIADERRRRQAKRVYQATGQHIKSISRPQKLKLTLAEAIRRALASSYAIKIAGYEPAISTAQVVEAEAQFDAAFYANWLDVVQDQATASSLQGSSSRMRTLGGGVRKLLSTGTQVDIGYNWTRTETDLAFQSLNPSYNNDMTIQLVQPLLRNFGLDFTRTQINIRKNEQRANVQKFRQQVRDTLIQVEQAYWDLVRKRRALTVTAEVLADTEETYRYIEARRDFDAFPILISKSKSAVDLQRVDLIRAIQQAREAEDTLRALINDAEMNLSDDIEIVPMDIPEAVPVVVDRLGEIQTALDHRSELSQRELEIENARLLVNSAKNQVMPKLDAVFTYKVTGLGSDPDRAFDQLSQNDFHEYQVGLQFEWPIGSRAARAGLKQARLRHRQAVLARKAQIEQVILDVNNAVRALDTAQEAIYPAMSATEAAEKDVYATKERAERMSPEALQTELASEQNLGQSRQTLLDALIIYNIAIADLERAKGTLLYYNNVALDEN